jgi:hypothetical protein
MAQRKDESMVATQVADVVTGATIAAVERFAAAVNAKDAAAIRACLTEDTVYETPDGVVLRGIADVAAYWEKFVAASPHGVFSLDGWLAVDDTADVRWTFRYPGSDGATVTLRGLDRLTVHAGKLSGKYSYVKR